MINRFFQFIGGDSGIWRVVKSNTLIGEPLLEVSRFDEEWKYIDWEVDSQLSGSLPDRARQVADA